MKKLSLFALFAALTLTGCKYTPVKTFTEAEDPTPLSEEAKAAWGGVKAGLNGAWGSPDFVYSRSEVPQNLTEEYAVAGWRGERVSAQ
ncbi:MAG: membrane lipoprotein lipid attachment site-containing protein, partial [Rikenellaceae bacterium]|nr:membrane lipoprotein lipid attachment site-containing protein [Rikenellaceae bacterium]